MGSTLLRKVWDLHTVRRLAGGQTQLFIGLHLVHEVTSPQAFTGLRQRGLKVRRPDRTLATMDHSIPTTPLDVPIADGVFLWVAVFDHNQARHTRHVHPVRIALEN